MPDQLPGGFFSVKNQCVFAGRGQNGKEKKRKPSAQDSACAEICTTLSVRLGRGAPR